MDVKSNIPLNCVLKINSHYDSLKSAEKKAADFILSSPEYIASHTISECAEKAGCSEPTFIRFARRIGYSGFANLKKDFKDVENKNYISELSNKQNISKEENVVREVFEFTIQTLKDTLEIFDYTAYDKALAALNHANRIYFGGIGDASAVAFAAAAKFTRIGYDCHSFNDPDLMLMAAANMKPEDVFVFISHSGRTKPIINVAKCIKKSHGKTIAITNYPATPLVKNCDISIYTSAFIEELKGEIMAKRVVSLCIIESLFTDLVLRNPLKRSLIEKCDEATKVNKC